MFNGSADDLVPQKGEVDLIGRVPMTNVDELFKSYKFTNSCFKIMEIIKEFVASGRMSQLIEVKMKPLT